MYNVLVYNANGSPLYTITCNDMKRAKRKVKALRKGSPRCIFRIEKGVMYHV